jgi:small subunit ribosomal protein S9
MIKKTVKKSSVAGESKKETKKISAVKHVVKSVSAKGGSSSDGKKESSSSKKRYVEAVGRRKTSVARVRLTPGASEIKINGKDYKEYLKSPKLQEIAIAPLTVLNLKDKHGFSIVLIGGGIVSQAEAIRHGISRALIKFDAELKKRLKKYDFLTRDSRMVERKKYGLKKARRAPQWAKR